MKLKLINLTKLIGPISFGIIYMDSINDFHQVEFHQALNNICSVFYNSKMMNCRIS